MVSQVVARSRTSSNSSATGVGGATSWRVFLFLRNFHAATGQPSRSVEGVLELLDDERLDHRQLDVAQVHQQLTEPPALQLGALDLQRLREGLRGEGAAGHQADAELRPAAGHDDGVDLAVPEVDLGLVALRVADEQAAGGAGVRQVEEHGLDGVGEEGTLWARASLLPRSWSYVTGPSG